MLYFNRLNPSELERLSILSEECGEVVHIIGKILRHGYDSFYDSNGDNRELLEKECGDIMAAIKLLYDTGDLDNNIIYDHSLTKRLNLRKWTHHQDWKELDGY